MRFRKGQLVKVVFDDHVQGADTPLRFIVYGRIQSSTKPAIVVDVWHYSDSKVVARDDNVERFTILKKTIVDAVELVEKEQTQKETKSGGKKENQCSTP